MKPKVSDIGKKSIQPPIPTSTTAGSKLWFKQINESLFKSSSVEKMTKYSGTKKLPGVGWKHSKAKESAPTRKITSSVHSVAGVPSGAGSGLTWQNLLQEKQKNKVLQLEIGRLKKSLKEKSEEIESKSKLVEKLRNEKTLIESTQNMTEDAADIENLLSANLGDVSLTDLLSMTESNFPADLIDLDLSEFGWMEESLACKVEAEDQDQIPNREANNGTEGGFVKDEDQLSVRGSLNGNILFKNYDMQKVSPIKMVKKDNQYQVDRKRKLQFSNQPSPSGINKKKLYMNISDDSEASKYLSCPSCKKKFAVGHQWKLTRHISLVHNTMNHSCQFCDKKFPCQSVLTAHIMAHQLSHPFQCGQCGYRLGQIREFLKHVMSAHKVTSNARARSMLVMTKD